MTYWTMHVRGSSLQRGVQLEFLPNGHVAGSALPTLAASDPLTVAFADNRRGEWKSHFGLPAATICELYRCRWQIELFFKWIKQHLRIKAFYGTSENAVKTQLWIAVSVYVLIAIIKKRLNLHGLALRTATDLEPHHVRKNFVGTTACSIRTAK